MVRMSCYSEWRMWVKRLELLGSYTIMALLSESLLRANWAAWIGRAAFMQLKKGNFIVSRDNKININEKIEIQIKR